jgi:hypothetical protein
MGGQTPSNQAQRSKQHGNGVKIAQNNGVKSIKPKRNFEAAKRLQNGVFGQLR